MGLVAVTVLVTVVWVAIEVRKPELSYQGKPLSECLKGFDAAQSSAEYAVAQEAIKAMGTNAVPVLVSYLRRKDPPFYEHWVNLIYKLRVKADVNYAADWKRRAAHGCGALGGEAEAAFPALMEAMDDPGAAWDVGNGLSRMMPKSVPVLTNILATGNERARARAADNLVTAWSHPSAEAMARTALLGALKDSDRGVRMAAASALHYWNTNLDLIVPELVRLLSDPDPSVRGNTATTLGNFGEAAKPAVPALVKLTQDTNAYVGATVADRAREMLKKIDPETGKE